jgi:hypothetical protein
MKVKAKYASLASKLTGGIWVLWQLLFFILKEGKPLEIEQTLAIIYQGLFFMFLFFPIDISMIKRTMPNILTNQNNTIDPTGLKI